MVFYEMKTYTLKPGNVPVFLETFARLARPTLARNGTGPETQCFSVIGPVNQIVQMWRFEGVGPMAASQAALASDPQWAEFQQACAALIVSEESRILVSVPAMGDQ